jgi:hypothetical protein
MWHAIKTFDANVLEEALDHQINQDNDNSNLNWEMH